MPNKPALTSISQSTAEDWKRISTEQASFISDLPNRILDHLQLLKGDAAGMAIDRLEHSLQAATLAHQAKESEEYVMCAFTARYRRYACRH